MTDFDKALAGASKGSFNLGEGADSGGYYDYIEQENTALDNVMAARQQYEPTPGTYETKSWALDNRYKEKQQRISPRDAAKTELQQGQSWSEGHSIVDGKAVQNHNKYYNNINGAEQQQYLSDMYDQRIYKDEQGKDYQLLDHTGERTYLDEDNPMDTGYLYMGGGKKDPNNVKIGYSKHGVKERYTPGLLKNDDGSASTYGWESGESGINAESAFVNWRLPDSLAKQGETVFHGNTGNIGARQMFDDGSMSSAQKRAELGSGASEYYDKSSMPLFNAKTENINKTNLNNSNDPLLKAAANYYESNDGRQLSNALSIGAGALNIGSNLLDTALESVAYLGEKAVGSNNFLEAAKSFADSDIETWNKRLNVNTEYQEEASRELMTAVENGDYAEAFNSVIENIDVHLAQSIPEMGAMAFKIPGLMATVNSRMQDMSTEFAKTNNRSMTKAEFGAALVTTTVALGAEQLFLIGPLKNIFKTIGGAKAVPKGLWKKVGSITGGIAVEGIQEPLDQLNENFWKKGGSGDAEGLDAFTEAGKRIASGDVMSVNEGIAASIAGAGMGGALKGGAEGPSGVVDGVVDGVKWMNNKRKQSKFKDAVADLSDAEYDVMIMDENKAIEEMELDNKSLEQTKKLVEEAGSVQEMIDSENLDIIETIDKIKKSGKLETDKSETFKTVKEKLKAHLNTASDADIDKRAEREKIDLELSREEKIKELMKDEAAFNQSSNKEKKTIESENLEGNFEKIKDVLSSAFNSALEASDNNLEISDKKIEIAQSARKKGQDRLSGKRRDAKVDLSKIEKLSKEPGSIMEAINVVTANIFNSEAKEISRATEMKLSEYDSESLNDFIDNSEVNGKEQKLARKIVARRERSEGNLGATTDYEENEDLSKKKDSKFSSAPSKKAENYAKIRRLVSQANISSKTERERIFDAIVALEEKGDITDAQANILAKRLNESSAYAKKSKGKKDRGAIFETLDEVIEDLTKESEKLKKMEANLEKEQKNEDSFEDTDEMKRDILKKKRYIKERQLEVRELVLEERKNQHKKKKKNKDDGSKDEDSGGTDTDPEPSSGGSTGGSKKKTPKKKIKKTQKKKTKKKNKKIEDAEHVANSEPTSNPIFDTKEGKLSGNYTKEELVLNDTTLPEGQELSEEIYDASELLNLC